MTKISTPNKSAGDQHSSDEYNAMKAAINAAYDTIEENKPKTITETERLIDTSVPLAGKKFDVTDETGKVIGLCTGDGQTQLKDLALIGSNEGGKTIPVGIKFTDDFVRASLGANYTIAGTFGTSAIQNNKLRLASTAAADHTKYLFRNDHKTTDFHVDIVLEAELVDISVAYSGIGIKLQPFGGSGKNYAFRLMCNGNPGRLDILFDNAETNQVPSGSYLAIATGDKVRLKVSLFKNVAFFQCNNLTTGKKNFATKTFPIDLAQTLWQPARFQAGITLFTGTFDVTKFEVISNSKKNADILFLGDSLTVGYNNVDYDDVWREQVAKNLFKKIAVMAGQGNSTQDTLDVLPEVIAATPKNVVMMIGQNDINQSVAMATVQANIQSIVNQLTTAGINVVLLANIPAGTTTQKSLADWILATYPANSIDCYYPFLLNTSTTTANTAFLASGHWTPAGNDAAAQILINELPALLV